MPTSGVRRPRKGTEIREDEARPAAEASKPLAKVKTTKGKKKKKKKRKMTVNARPVKKTGGGVGTMTQAPNGQDATLAFANLRLVSKARKKFRNGKWQQGKGSQMKKGAQEEKADGERGTGGREAGEEEREANQHRQNRKKSMATVMNAVLNFKRVLRNKIKNPDEEAGAANSPPRKLSIRSIINNNSSVTTLRKKAPSPSWISQYIEQSASAYNHRSQMDGFEFLFEYKAHCGNTLKVGASLSNSFDPLGRIASACTNDLPLYQHHY